MRRDWTSEETARLRQLAHEGLSFRQIAAVVGRTYGSVTGHAQRLEIRTGDQQRWTSREQLRAQELYRAGHTCAEVAAALGRRDGSVYALLHRKGVTTRARCGWHRVPSPALRYGVAREGWTAIEVMAILGLTCARKTFLAWITRYAERAELPAVKWPRGVRPFRHADVAARREELLRAGAL